MVCIQLCIWYEIEYLLIFLSHSFACGYPVAPAPFVEKTISSPLNCLGNFIEIQLTINVKAYLWTLNSIPLSYVLALYK